MPLAEHSLDAEMSDHVARGVVMHAGFCRLFKRICDLPQRTEFGFQFWGLTLVVGILVPLVLVAVPRFGRDPKLLTLAAAGMDAAETERLLEQFMDAATSGRIVDTETRVENGGEVKWLRIIGEPVGEDVAITFVDVTDGKAKEERMESIARSDPLTGVLNRRGFERDASLRLSESADEATGALLFIDLNDFKQINDQCGHEIGDQLLRIAAERLKKSLRSHDIIGRPGGDEFVALVPDVSAAIADKLAVRLTKSLEEPYFIGDKTLQCAASIGLALYPDNANTLTGLLREADEAMYRAKARCRGVTDIRGDDLLEKAI